MRKKENELGTPVIISHAELHESISPLEKIGPVMVQAAEKAGVPVCVQLDHGETLEYIERSLEIGFTGVMYDGSLLPYEENLANTKKAVAMARKFNAGVEAELGAMPSREGGEAASGPVYTDPEQAVEFCKETGIDALAPSFGTAHGIYKAKPMLDLERVHTIACTAGAVFQRKITAERSGQAFARSITTPICPMQEAGRSGNSSQRKT